MTGVPCRPKAGLQVGPPSDGTHEIPNFWQGFAILTWVGLLEYFSLTASGEVRNTKNMLSIVGERLHALHTSRRGSYTD